MTNRMIQGWAFACTGLAALWLPGASLADSLREALAAAYSTNPEIRSSRAALRVADEDIAIAMSGWRPNLSYFGTAGKAHSDRTNLTDHQNTTPFNNEFRLTQSLYSGNSTVSGVKQAESIVDVRRDELLSVENNILSNAAVAYLDVVRDEARLELARGNEKVLQRQLEASNDRFEVGEVTRTDVAQSEARLSRAVANRITATGTLAISRATYQQVIGKAPKNLEPVSELPEMPKSREHAVEVALKNNPQLIAAGHSEEAAGHATDVAFSRLLPTVNLIGSIQRNYDSTFEDLDVETESLTARVTIPLYQSGSVQAAVRQSKEEHSQRRIEIETTRRRVVERAAQAFEAFDTSRSEIVSRKEQIRANEIALEGVRQEAEVGSRTTLDVLDAEQELLDARVSLVITERNEYVAAYRLLEAMGLLTAQNLALKVEIYDPTKHTKETRDKWWGIEVKSE